MCYFLLIGQLDRTLSTVFVLILTYIPGQVGGVPCDEMNALEMEFLFSINFSLHVNTDTYCRYFAELSSHMQPCVEMQPIPPSPETLQMRKTEQGMTKDGSSSTNQPQEASSDTNKAKDTDDEGNVHMNGSTKSAKYVTGNNCQSMDQDHAVVETAVVS